MDLVFGSVSKAGTLDLQFPYITFCGKSTHSVGSAFKKTPLVSESPFGGCKTGMLVVEPER